MGLGSKIKNALSSDHEHDPVQRTSGPHSKAPGSYPGEDYLGNSSTNNNSATGGNSTKHTGPAGLASGSNKLHKGGAQDEYDPYGAESGPKSATSQRSYDSGVGGVGNTSTDVKDHSTPAGYWGDMKPGNNNAAMANNDLPDRSRYSQPGGNAMGNHPHDSRMANQVVGSGVHNGAVGHGTNHHSGGGHSNQLPQPGAVHDPLTSGTRGVPTNSDARYNENYASGNNMPGSHGQGETTSKTFTSPGSGPNSGVVGSGMQNGGQQGHYAYGNTSQGPQSSSHMGGGGIPKSSMLDPESTGAPMANQTQHQGPHHGHPHAAGYSEPPMNQHSAYNQSASGPASSSSPMNQNSTYNSSGPGNTSSSATSGSKSHQGPGHDAAKVLHKCDHCGGDNDISRYFKNDVVYRLGS